MRLSTYNIRQRKTTIYYKTRIWPYTWFQRLHWFSQSKGIILLLIIEHLSPYWLSREIFLVTWLSPHSIFTTFITFTHISIKLLFYLLYSVLSFVFFLFLSFFSLVSFFFRPLTFLHLFLSLKRNDDKRDCVMWTHLKKKTFEHSFQTLLCLFTCFTTGTTWQRKSFPPHPPPGTHIPLVDRKAELPCVPKIVSYDNFGGERVVRITQHLLFVSFSLSLFLGQFCLECVCVVCS